MAEFDFQVFFINNERKYDINRLIVYEQWCIGRYTPYTPNANFIRNVGITYEKYDNTLVYCIPY